ncbi:MAG: SIMPL domain-containing protein [Phormidesmis sp.]
MSSIKSKTSSKISLSRRWSRSLALASLAIAPLASCAMFPPSASAQAQPVYQQPERVLNVTGQGMQTIPTTLTQVSLGVMVEEDTAEEAQQAAARRSNAVVDFVRSQTVQKLETTGVSLSPRYDYSNDRQVIIGYQATNTISFRAATDVAGTVIDGAVKAGATNINGVSFVAADDAIAAARQTALTAAIEDAQQQSDTVLSALGLSAQEIVNITIGNVSAPPPRPVQYEARALADQVAPTPIVGQEQTISAQVTLQIRY